LKLAGPKPAAPVDNTPTADAGFGDDQQATQPTSDDKPFDAEPFNAGVEADEQSDPKKFIEQLTGKLGQSLRKYNEQQGQPDFELEKFAINSLLSASHTSEMDANDQEDIIKKVKEAGNHDDNGEDKKDDNGDSSSDSNGDGSNNGNGGNDGGNTDIADLSNNSPDAGGEGVNEETQIFLDNPKKNNMFQKGSNDILDNDLNISEKSSNIAKIKDKLQETFNQEDMSEPMVEPQVKPAPEVEPAPDKVKPSIAPSRKNKPFLPMPDPSIKPDPKADVSEMMQPAVNMEMANKVILIKSKTNDIFYLKITFDNKGRVDKIDNKWDVNFPDWYGHTPNESEIQNWINKKEPKLYIVKN